MNERDTWRAENETRPSDPVLHYPPPQGPPAEAPEEPSPPPPPPQTPPAQAVEPPPQYAPPPPPPPPAPAAARPAGPSLLARAKADDGEALATMFAPFLPKGKQVVASHYLGVLGFWGIGTHSFAAVTARRIASLRISLLGGVQYQDGALEYVNSAAVFQPSKVMLYVYATAISLFAFVFGFAIHPALSIVTLLLSLLFLPLTIRIYYRLKKSGLVLWVREGLMVYTFIDRKRMRVSNQLYRTATNLREERLKVLGHP
jgi:hypothetical protein